MTRIALTGAAGNVGRELLGAFDDSNELIPFTHSRHDDVDSDLLDVTDPDDVIDKLDNVDVVTVGLGELRGRFEAALWTDRGTRNRDRGRGRQLRFRRRERVTGEPRRPDIHPRL